MNKRLLVNYIKKIILLEQNLVKYNFLISALENSNKSDLLDNISQNQVENQISKLKKYQFQWLINYINSDIVEDVDFPEIIETILEFDKKKNSFNKDKEGKSKNKDIAAYKSIEEIKSVLGPSNRDLTKQEREKNLSESDIVYEDDRITIYFPHSKEASCEIGNRKGLGHMRWCTTTEKKETPNRFYEYTLGYGLNLYYIFSKIETEKYMNKISVAVKDNKIFHGNNATVNAENHDLSDAKLSNYFGKEYWNKIKNAIINFDKKYENAHPGINYIKEKEDIAKVTKDKNLQIELANDPDPNVRRWMARNPFIDKELQLKFTKDVYKVVRGFLSWNSNLDKEVFLILMKDDEVNNLLAANPDLKKEFQLILVEKGSGRVREALAENPNIDREVQLILAEKGDNHVRRILLKNPNLDKELQLIFAEKGSDDVRQGLADNPNIDKETQLILAEKGDGWVRYYLAKNRNIDKELQLILAEKGDDYIRGTLAKNPNIDKEIQLILAEKGDDYIVRKTLAENPNIDREVQLILAENGDERVRVFLASSPNIDKETQLILVEKGSDRVRSILRKNRNLDPEIRRMLENE